MSRNKSYTTPGEHPIYRELESSILLLDGAMGSLIQEYHLTETDFRGKRFAGFRHDLKGNNDLLSLTQPCDIGF